MPVTTKGYKPGVPVQKQKFVSSQTDEAHQIITPLYEEWLLEHPEPTADPKVFDRVMRELLKPQRDRSGSFSASSAGYCMRRQELAYLGVPKVMIDSPRGVRIYQNGTYFHLRTQVALLSAGIVSDIEYTVKRGPYRGTLDGIGVARRGVYSGLRFTAELKGRMSFSYASQERSETPDAKTREQVARQMFLTGYEVSSVFNENKDTQETLEFVIERNEEEVKDAKNQLDELTRAIEKQELHPMLRECVKMNKTGEYFKCPFGTDDGACSHVGSWPRKV
jgi:hypothetical protein